MSSEKTADMFKDKSEEEIMNWMIKYMTPEQIKSCFEGELPEELPVEQPKKLDINDLRKFCANKRYVIHRIEGNKVYFWYYLIKSKKWLYSIEPLENFPKVLGEEAQECGLEEEVTEDFRADLMEAYNKNLTSPGERFNENNPGEDQSKIFQDIKAEYETRGINESWKVVDAADTLLAALNIQKEVKVLPEQKQIFKFAPVLIESTTSTNVNYYYLINNDGNLKFVEGNLPIDEFRQDLIDIINELDLKIIISSQAGGSADSKTVEEWKLAIKKAASDIYSDDLERIKEVIYSEFPLSEDSTYFMKNLFSDSEFGNRFGESTRFNSVNLSNFVSNKFGKRTAELFNAKVISNKFGTQTIALVSK